MYDIYCIVDMHEHTHPSNILLHRWTNQTTREALHHLLFCTPIIHSNSRRNRQHDSLLIHRLCEEGDYFPAKTYSEVHPTDHWISIEARDIPIHSRQPGWTSFFQCHLSAIIIVQDQSTVYIGLWLNERKAKQTLGINLILGMNDNVGKLDILIFTSAYR